METPRQDACRGVFLRNPSNPCSLPVKGPARGPGRLFQITFRAPKDFSMFPRFLYPGPRLPQHGQGRIGGLAGGAAAGIQQGPAQILV